MKERGRRWFGFWILLCGLFLLHAGTASGISTPSPETFPLPAALEPAVRFWVRVYAQCECNEYLIHDTERMGVVYEVTRIESLDPDRPDLELTRSQEHFLGSRKEHYRILLKELSSAGIDYDRLTGDRKKVFDLFGGSRNPHVYAHAAANLRAQRGQKARFRQGLIRSGRYDQVISDTLRDYDVPEELRVLPHAESSFNYRAYSSAGAAGIWQFTRPTGRLYLKINHDIDERLDPILSTRAAAKLLSYNYGELGSWPLAITAYNHGLGGMQRARRLLGTSDIGEIVSRYQSPYFGFASRNFYAEFLAALYVVEHYRDYFGEVSFEPPLQFRELELPRYVKIQTLARNLNLETEDLANFNPALRKPILQGARSLPKGYRLRVPAQVEAETLIARIPSREWSQKEGNWYRVERGDTLASIARRNGTSVATLVALNELASSRLIRVGQMVRLPEEKSPEKAPEQAPIQTASLSEGAAAADSKAGEVVEAGQKPLMASMVPIPAIAEASIRRDEPRSQEASRVEADPPSSGTAGIELVRNSRPKAGYIRIEPEETLGHYADWLNVSIRKIRQWNRLSSKAHIRSGQRLKLVFERVTPDQFQSARVAYHRGIEEDFFNNHKVMSTFPHELKKGESIWRICSQYNLPHWLILRYNTQLDSGRAKPGDVIQIPDVASANPTSS
ncbi:MAG: LysM peptidoglycan-binding domain-containing protein [bacterium]